ncbi:g7562 [Coccomyxa viridis]|uniref:G7562 protein n=1 Tax=Coccomyxa viridis TaxID=1274662 RepID=A0ABP1FY54_9CHLO
MAYMVSDRRPDPFEKLFLNQRPGYKSPTSIPINIKEAALPGLTKEDIRVNVNGDVLTIYVPTEEEKAAEEGKTGQETSKQTETAQEKQKNGDPKYHRHEIVKIFKPRPIRLPQDANTDDIKAEYADGILTIIIKRESDKAKKQDIQVQ